MVEVLLSCMHQTDDTIINKSNLSRERVLIVNQCEVACDELKQGDILHRMINTKTRGLSISRNIALENAVGEICVISDDDEVFFDDLSCIIQKVYDENKEADIIVFNLENRHQKLGLKKKWLKKYELLRVASWQITFRRASVVGKVKFDTKLGAGTGNGGGEENKFLFDCYKCGLRILYVPISIAVGIEDASSTWFFGYDEQYFRKLGCVIRYLLGKPIGFVYCVYTVITKYGLYKKEMSMWKAFRYIFRGFFREKLG